MIILDQVRDALRAHHQSIFIEEAYCYWVRRFMVFHGARNPQQFDTTDVAAFLSHLADSEQVSPFTQELACDALRFLFQQVLSQSFPEHFEFTRAKPSASLPVVLTRDEVQRLFAHLEGRDWLMAGLLYGSGLRLTECVRLRVRDIDLNRCSIVIRDDSGAGKEARERRVTLDEQLVPHMRIHMAHVRNQHLQSLNRGGGRVQLPAILEQRHPNAGRDWLWQYVFPAVSDAAVSSHQPGQHLSEHLLQQAVKRAALAAGIQKPATCHTLRHAFATHLLERGYDIQTVQAQLGHRDLKASQAVTHLLEQESIRVMSPFGSVVKPRAVAYGAKPKPGPGKVEETQGVYLIAS